MPEDELKGVGGWLLLFIIGMVFLVPILQILNFLIFWDSGLYSIIITSGLALLSLFIGISLWTKNRMAVAWTKEFLIVRLIIAVLFVVFILISPNLFPSEEISSFGIDLFSNIVAFAIWFSYFNKSKRVANTFEKRNFGWKRIFWATGVIIAVYIFSLLIAL